MITREEIENIIEEAKSAKNTITPTDINNVILSRFVEDRDLIVPNSTDYFQKKPIKWLQKYMSDNIFDNEIITFDENKKALIELIEKNKRMLEAGEIDAKDALKIEADIRTKLNDKFNVKSGASEKIVVVPAKYNGICERYHCECYLPTKEELMKTYNLVEKK